MSIWYAIGATAGVVYLALCAWFVFEIITAPLVDEEFRVISDPHHRMTGPPRSGWYRKRPRSLPERTGSTTAQADGDPVIGLIKP